MYVYICIYSVYAYIHSYIHKYTYKYISNRTPGSRLPGYRDTLRDGFAMTLNLGVASALKEWGRVAICSTEFYGVVGARLLSFPDIRCTFCTTVLTQVGLQKPCGLSSSEWSKTLQKGSSPMDRQRDISEHSQRNACPVHSSVPPDGEKPLSTNQEKVTSNSEQERHPVFDHPISSIISTDKPNSKCYPKL